MRIGGILKFSTLDYPGKLSCVVFCQGCPLRCQYCHNPDFLDTQSIGNVQYEDLIEFLRQRVGYLDAVVFSGGEPLMQPDLLNSMNAAKELDFLIGLHTSGVMHQQFGAVLHLVDWIGFDVKTTFEKYHLITGIKDSGHFSQHSFEKLLSSGVNYEIRTTFDSRYISELDLEEVAKMLQNYNVEKWIIQECILRETGKKIKLPMPNQNTIDRLSRYVQIEVRYE
jgi:pyruvate formate lyase activating enzyme